MEKLIGFVALFVNFDCGKKKIWYFTYFTKWYKKQFSTQARPDSDAKLQDLQSAVVQIAEESRARKVFEEVDADRDGFLTRSAAQRAMQTLCRNQRQFEDMPNSNSGNVLLKTFVEYYMGKSQLKENDPQFGRGDLELLLVGKIGSR